MSATTICMLLSERSATASAPQSLRPSVAVRLRHSIRALAGCRWAAAWHPNNLPLGAAAIGDLASEARGHCNWHGATLVLSHPLLAPVAESHARELAHWNAGASHPLLAPRAERHVRELLPANGAIPANAQPLNYAAPVISVLAPRQEANLVAGREGREADRAARVAAGPQALLHLAAGWLAAAALQARDEAARGGGSGFVAAEHGVEVLIAHFVDCLLQALVDEQQLPRRLLCCNNGGGSQG